MKISEKVARLALILKEQVSWLLLWLQGLRSEEAGAAGQKMPVKLWALASSVSPFPLLCVGTLSQAGQGSSCL